jgi:hypothetical protein
MSAKHHHKLQKVAMLVRIAVVASVLAACGSSSLTQEAGQRARQTPAQSGPDIGTSAAQIGHRAGTSAAQIAHRAGSRPDSSNVSVGRTEKGKATSASNDGVSDIARSAFNPCTLVSMKEAQSIVGGSITDRFEAPLGPTCVYKMAGTKSLITLAVESLNLSQIRHEMTKPQPLALGRHGAFRAYCGRLGQQMLFAPLSTRGEVLNVTAQCPIAQRFAALALTRLEA